MAHMGDFTGHDRRFERQDGSGAPVVVCKVCWDRIPLQRERIEIADGRVYYRCQSCEGSFLVRWEDAVALGAVDARTDPAVEAGADPTGTPA